LHEHYYTIDDTANTGELYGSFPYLHVSKLCVIVAVAYYCLTRLLSASVRRRRLVSLVDASV